MLPVMLSIALAYAGIFVAGWNFHYPTPLEQFLWRLCTLGTQIIVTIGGCYEISMMLLEYQKHKRDAISHLVPNPDIELVPRFQTTRLQPESMGPPTRWQAILQGLRNRSEDRDPELDVPLLSLLITTPLCALYCLFRMFILVEDFVSLRRLPDSAFVTIVWSAYIPHF
jgi:hypothetical protein